MPAYKKNEIDAWTSTCSSESINPVLLITPESDKNPTVHYEKWIMN